MAKRDATPETTGNTVVVDDIGPSRKKITITVPASAVDEQLEQALTGLASEAALPGFRPGRAPRRLVEKRFGETVRKETKGQLISGAYSRAIEEHKLTPLGDPEGNEALEALVVEAGKAVTFSLEVEVAPEFELPAVEGIEVLKPLIRPSDEEVDEQLKRLAVNEGELVPHDRAGPGDYCIGHGVMKAADGGEVILDLRGAVIQVPGEGSDGRGAILGVMVDDFAAQVGNPKAGETVTVRATAPEQHERENIRGKALEISFQVDQVQQIVPATTEALVARYGMENEQQLREAVMLRLNQRALVEQAMAMRQQIAKRLLDAVDLALPERLSARQAERNLARARMELMYRGWDEQQIERRVAELRGATGAQAQRELKLFFILAKVADQFQVGVKEEEVLGRIAQIAAERNERMDTLRKELVRRNQIGVIAQQVREHKTLDLLLSKAKVTEVSLEEFNEKAKSWREDGAGGGGGDAESKSPSKKKSGAKGG